MARIYIVPSSLFVQGRLGSARRFEQDKERVLRRKAALEQELATIPAKVDELDRQIATYSLEKWRVG
jgi:hypothetical protein